MSVPRVIRTTPHIWCLKTFSFRNRAVIRTITIILTPRSITDIEIDVRRPPIWERVEPRKSRKAVEQKEYFPSFDILPGRIGGELSGIWVSWGGIVLV